MIHIDKNKKIPKSLHNKVLILTDLEPDDVLALRMLRKVISADPNFAGLGEVPILVVVGESTCDKTNMMYDIMGEYKYTNYTVVQGEHSSKDFPTAGLSSYKRAKLTAINNPDVYNVIRTFLQTDNSSDSSVPAL